MSHDHHACDEFNRRDLMRRALAQSAQHVPVPDALLDEGATKFFDRQMSRKGFLGRSAGLMLGIAAAKAMAPGRLLEEAAAAADPNAPILVTIYLGGGNDGLNTLVPRAGVERSLYEANRTHVGIAPDTLLPVKGRDEFGWNPAATGLQKLFDAGKLAVLTGVDYPNPTMSHFESEHFFRTGTLSNDEKLGWLGRYLDRVGTGNPLEGIAVQWGGDGALVGQRAATCAVHDPGSYGFWSPGVWDGDSMTDTWGHLGTSSAKSPAYKRAVDTARQTYKVKQQLTQLAKEDVDKLPAPPISYPADYQLGEELRTLGRLLGAGLGTRVATLVDSQGYDTHDDQTEMHAHNWGLLSEALVAFQADLEQRGLGKRVVTMIWSEFGRRAEDNDSGGTDHGAGGLMLLMGQRVKGEVLAEGWGLTALDEDGNLPVTIDFRDVYAGILEGHLGTSAKDVLPGYAGTPQQLFAA
ncbi:MAG: DUF1501 domain-containing protein [Thermoleophilia bacterium]|nr:DUF1501 domain-containing protein [Thermoleophilia bacterium]